MNIQADGGWVLAVLFIIMFFFFLSRMGLSMPARFSKKTAVEKKKTGSEGQDVEGEKKVVETTKASERKAHDDGHGHKLGFLTVLLIVIVVGELCTGFAIGGPAFVRAINAPYDFKAHNTILPQSAFASKQAVVTCDPSRSNPVSVPSIGTWSDEIHVPRGCIPYTNPVIDGVVVEAQCREVSTSGWEQCLGTYVSIRMRSVRDVDVWMEQYKG